MSVIYGAVLHTHVSIVPRPIPPQQGLCATNVCLVVERIRDWVLASYPFAVIRRFFELQMLDNPFVLSAQAFVALLPIVIVLISAVFQSDGVGLAISLSDRFGLEGAARDAVVGLFNAPEHTMALSWLAIVMSLLSAWSLGRRLATTYATIFDLPPLPRKQMWRALVWVVVMALVIVSTSQLRDIAHAYGVWALILGSLGLLLLWFGGMYLSIRVVVPALSRGLLLATAIVGVVGQLGLTIWASVYMPRALTSQAEQFGPIGVTFALFTFVLVAATLTLIAPLMVNVWHQRARARLAR